MKIRLFAFMIYLISLALLSVPTFADTPVTEKIADELTTVEEADVQNEVNDLKKEAIQSTQDEVDSTRLRHGGLY